MGHSDGQLAFELDVNQLVSALIGRMPLTDPASQHRFKDHSARGGPGGIGGMPSGAVSSMMPWYSEGSSSSHGGGRQPGGIGSSGPFSSSSSQSSSFSERPSAHRTSERPSASRTPVQVAAAAAVVSAQPAVAGSRSSDQIPWQQHALNRSGSTTATSSGTTHTMSNSSQGSSSTARTTSNSSQGSSGTTHTDTQNSSNGSRGATSTASTSGISDMAAARQQAAVALQQALGVGSFASADGEEFQQVGEGRGHPHPPPFCCPAPWLVAEHL